MKKWKAPAGPTGGIPVCHRRNLWYNTLKPNRAGPRRPCRRNHRKVIGMIEQVMKVYTEDPEVIRCGVEILSITTVPYFLCGIMDLFPGALRGMGHSGVPMILSIIGTVGTRIVWIFWIFPQHRSLYTLFISYPASWFITIVLQVICFVFVRRTVHGQLKGTGETV